MLTKKTYVLIAEALRGLKNTKQVDTKDEALSYLIGWLSESLTRDNPKFKENKFKDYINKE